MGARTAGAERCGAGVFDGDREGAGGGAAGIAGLKEDRRSASAMLEAAMSRLDRIAQDPAVMGGKPCI